MAKKQLAKAVLDRIKRSAKSNPYPGKKPKPKFVVTSSKTISEGKKSAPKAKTFKQTKAAKKPGFKTGVAAGTAVSVAASKGLGMKKAKSKESPTKRMADDAYKKQKEKQKKYYDKKTESKRK